MDYQPRIADAVLARGLKSSGAVLIEGVKACGKTETATRVARSAARFDTDSDVPIKMDANMFGHPRPDLSPNQHALQVIPKARRSVSRQLSAMGKRLPHCAPCSPW